jgi:hypothetical protein
MRDSSATHAPRESCQTDFPHGLPDTWERDVNGKPKRKRENVETVIDRTMIDGFISAGDPSGKGVVSDTHNAWYLSPEKYTLAVDALLDTLEKQQ